MVLSDERYSKIRNKIISFIKREGLEYSASGSIVMHQGYEGKLKMSPRQREGLYNLKLFVKHCIRKRIRQDFDSVIAITGENGTGKSVLAIYMSLLADPKYRLDKNCLYIPDENEFTNTFNKMHKYEVIHVDEAARSMHKHKWSSNLQQKINLLYDVEARKKQIATILILPRFTDLNEKFRNFRVRYWIHVMARGWAIIQERDADKDLDDPWHMKEYFKLKAKKTTGRSLNTQENILIEEKICARNFVGTLWFPDIIPTLKTEYLTQLKIAKKIDKKKTKEESESGRKELMAKAKVKTKQVNGVNILLFKGANMTEASKILGISTSAIRDIKKKHKLPHERDINIKEVIDTWSSFSDLIVD